MRVWFVVLDDVFFLPPYLEGTISRLDDDFDVVGITPVSEFSSAGEFLKLAVERVQMFGVVSTVFLGLLGVLFRTVDLVFGKVAGRCFSVETVARTHGIPVVQPEDVNDRAFVERIDAEEVDVVVSSNPAIFETELLEAPDIGCINRHTSYLPWNRGRYPVYWALLEGQHRVGASVHWMEEAVDEGEIIHRERFPIRESDSMVSLYIRGYRLSQKLTARALEQIRDGDVTGTPNEGGTYHSTPTREAIKRFREQPRPVVRLSDAWRLTRW